MIFASDVCALLLVAISINATSIYFEEERSACCEGETCIEIKDCPSALEVVDKRKHPKHCGFVEKVPYVCCKDKIGVTTEHFIVESPSSPLTIDKLNNQRTNVANVTTTIYTTTEKTTFVPATIATPTALSTIQNATGYKAEQQCNRTYDRLTDGYFIKPARRYDQTKTEENPFAAALGHREDEKIEFICAGSLISETFVLTAAHCIDDNNINYIRLGDLNLKDNNDNVEPQNFTVAKTFLNPNYKKNLRYHDIGLIKLDRPVNISKYVKPVCLKFGGLLGETNLHIVGYKNKNATDYLYDEVLAYTNRRVCRYHFKLKEFKEFLPNGVDYENQICANGVYKTSPCQFDAGGPMHISNWGYTDGKRLIAITSIEKLCNNKNAPGLYIRINNYIPWIESIVWPDN